MWLPVEGRDRIVSDRVEMALHIAPTPESKQILKQLDGLPEDVVHITRAMHWWGKDEFFLLYGGRDFIDQVGRERLVMNYGKDILFVEKVQWIKFIVSVYSKRKFLSTKKIP